MNLDFIEEADRSWTVAQKTIEKLKRRNVSYIALVMDKNDNLLVYKGKGRHSAEETQMIESKGNLKPMLRDLRKKTPTQQH